MISESAKQPSWKFILSLVLLIHITFVIWLYFASSWKPLATPQKKVITAVFIKQQTPVFVEEKKPLIEESVPIEKEPEPQPEETPGPAPIIEEKKTPPAETKKPSVKPIQNKKKPSPAPIRQAVNKTSSTVSKPIKKAPAKPSNPSYDKQHQLLAKAKEKMNKIQKNRFQKDSVFDSTSTPTLIDALSSDQLFIDSPASLNLQEISYRDELASRLKVLMKLPEYGEVKLRLTLNRAGQVLQVKILQSESHSNKAHVEKILPTLKMPPFGNNFGNKAEYTFTITMSNV